MPTSPASGCPAPGCAARGGLCQRHAAERERARGSSSARGYSGDGGAWKAFSRAWLHEFQWCGQRQDGKFYTEHSRCAARGEMKRAQVTDHIRSLRSGGAHLSRANSQSLCTACNTAKDAKRGTR